MKDKYFIIASVILVAIAAGLVFFASQRQKSIQKQLEVETATIATVAPTSATKAIPSITLITEIKQQENQIALTIIEPKNNQIVTSPNLTLTGKTVPNAEVFVNDQETAADAIGNFSVTLSLDEGDNIINITADDEDGNYSERELTVTYEPQE